MISPSLNLHKAQVISTIAIVSVVAIRLMMFLQYPFLGTDAAWSLSPVFSYLVGEPEMSLFAHEFMGNTFKPVVTDAILAAWFRMFGVTTIGLISLGLFTVTLSSLIWIWLFPRGHDAGVLACLMGIAYALSPYAYGFRSETYCILTISLMMTILFSDGNLRLRVITATALLVLTGILHPVGGLFGGLIFFFVCVTKIRLSIREWLLASLTGVLVAYLLSEGDPVGLILGYTRVPSESGNRLNGLNFELLVKFFVLGSPVPFIVAFVHSWRNWREVAFAIFCIFLFTILGRSYYLLYSFMLALAISVGVPLAEESIRRRAKYMLGRRLLITVLTVTAVPYLFLPLAFRVASASANHQWRSIITAMDVEEKHWSSDSLYYVPSQLGMEVVDNPKARLLYGFLRHNEGMKDVANRVFYVYNLKQRELILQNFSTNCKYEVVRTIVEPKAGEIRLSSIYKFNVIRGDSIGLWKIAFQSMIK